MKKKHEPKKIKVYKNSDGFLTEDKQQYTEREKILNKMKKDNWLHYLDIDLRYWSKSKKDRDYQDKMIELIGEDRKNACGVCFGSGCSDESSYCGSYSVGCSDCGGSGLKESYRKKTGRTRYMEGTWYKS